MAPAAAVGLSNHNGSARVRVTSCTKTRSMGEKKQKAWFHAQTPWQEEPGRTHWWHIYHWNKLIENICAPQHTASTPLSLSPWLQAWLIDLGYTVFRLLARSLFHTYMQTRKSQLAFLQYFDNKIKSDNEHTLIMITFTLYLIRSI